MSTKNFFGWFEHFGECGQVKKLLFEYVEGELAPETQQKLERHLGDCPACLKFVKSYREIISLTHDHCVLETPLPPALKQKLREFIEQNPDLK